MFTKINSLESGYFGAKIDILIKTIAEKNQNSEINNSF